MLSLETNPNIVKPNYSGERTVIWIPSIFFSEYVAQHFTESRYFEERNLYFLYFLKQKNTKLVVVMSEGFTPAIVEYFMFHISKITGITTEEINERFTLIAVPSPDSRPLAAHILESESVLEKIESTIDSKETTFLETFTVSPLEIKLAKKLQLPLYGLDKSMWTINTKSNSRRLFFEADIAMPKGFEDLFSLEEVQKALQKLLKLTPAKKFVLKINEGGAGFGFLFFSRKAAEMNYDDFLKQAKIENEQNYESVSNFLLENGSIVEEFIEGEEVFSPSIQFEIFPDGTIENLSTHDQILRDTVYYVGVNFPSQSDYRDELIEAGTKIAELARDKGVRGIFSLDFIAAKQNGNWNLYALEVNARKSATNHPYKWAKHLTNATYNQKRGILECDKGDVYYRATERFIQGMDLLEKHDVLKKKKPQAFIEMIQNSGLDFDHNTKAGVFIHLLSPLRTFGEFGTTVIGRSRKEVEEYWQRLRAVVGEL